MGQGILRRKNELRLRLRRGMDLLRDTGGRRQNRGIRSPGGVLARPDDTKGRESNGRDKEDASPGIY